VQPLLSATSSSHGRGAKQWRLRRPCSRPSMFALPISPAASRPYISHPTSTCQRGGCSFAGRRHLVQPSSASSTPPTPPRRPRERKLRRTVGWHSPRRRTTGQAHCTLNSCVKRCSRSEAAFAVVWFSCLPSDLEGAIRQSGKASADFVNSGGLRAIV
jgi:hypothetical protein